MTRKNKLFNKEFNVKRLRRKDCRNVGYYKNSIENYIVSKYDWSKPMTYITLTIQVR